jgi:hypothetical protein
MSSTTENDTSNEDPPEDDFPGEKEKLWLGGESPLEAEEWKLLRAPFSRHAYVVDTRAGGRTPEQFAGEDDLYTTVVDLHLRAEAVRGRLDWVIGPGQYSYRFEPGPQDGGQRSVFCHFQLGDATRTGTGTASSLKMARRIALAEAAAAFGIGTSGRAAGPVTAERKMWNEVPDSILDTLEVRDEPEFWGPGDSPPEDASPADTAA